MSFVISFSCVNSCFSLSAQQIFIFFSLPLVPSLDNQETSDILLLDLSAEVDSNQNCIKGNAFTSCTPNPWGAPQTENPFSSSFGFFPTPDTDPFGNDPLAQSAPPRSLISAPSTNHIQESSANFLGGPIGSGVGLTEDSDNFGQQLSELSNRNMILALSNGQWPLGGVMTEESRVPVQNGLGSVHSPQNPFLDGSGKSPLLCKDVMFDPQLPAPVGPSKDGSVVISPPPQSTKAGRGRRSAKVKLHRGPMMLLHV
jgi:disabled family protein 2